MSAFKCDPLELTMQQYSILVYWLEGRLGTTAVAGRTKAGPGTVRHVAHHYLLTPKTEMSIEQRQAALNELASHRAMFTGWEKENLDDIFKAKTIKVLPMKPRKIEKVETIDLTTKEGKAKAKALMKAATERENEERRRREQIADRGLASRRQMPDALEWLRINGWLADREERSTNAAQNKSAPSSARRHKAAELFRKYSDGAKISALSGTDYESMIMGSGSGVPLTLSEYRLTCINMIGHIGRWLGEDILGLLEAVICRDEFVWEARAGSRSAVMSIVHRGLDIVAVHEGLMTRHAFRDQWLHDLPFDDPPTRHEVAHQLERVASLLRKALAD